MRLRRKLGNYRNRFPNSFTLYAGNRSTFGSLLGTFGQSTSSGIHDPQWKSLGFKLEEERTRVLKLRELYSVRSVSVNFTDIGWTRSKDSIPAIAGDVPIYNPSIFDLNAIKQCINMYEIQPGYRQLRQGGSYNSFHNVRINDVLIDRLKTGIRY